MDNRSVPTAAVQWVTSGFTAVVYKADHQRLKEAIWRIQDLVTKGRLANYRVRQINAELDLLAKALGVELL